MISPALVLGTGNVGMGCWPQLALPESGSWFSTPKKKARQAVKAKIRDIIRRGGATPSGILVKRINATLAGWVNYFRVGNASRAFSEVHNYVEMKIRTLLTRRKRLQKRSIGWRRWSNEYLYEVLGLFWDWRLQPLPGVENLE